MSYGNFSQVIVDEDGKLVQSISKVRHLRDTARHKDRIRVFGELVWKERPLERNGYVREALQSMAPDVLRLLQITQPEEFLQWEGFKKVRDEPLLSESLLPYQHNSAVQVLACKLASKDALDFDIQVMQSTTELSSIPLWKLLVWYFRFLRHALTHLRSDSLVRILLLC